MTEIIHRKLLWWTIAYYSLDYDEIHVDKKFVGTPLYDFIMEHEMKHAEIGWNIWRQVKFDIAELIRGNHFKALVGAIRFKPLCVLNFLIPFIVFPLDDLELKQWRRKVMQNV